MAFALEPSGVFAWSAAQKLPKLRADTVKEVTFMNPTQLPTDGTLPLLVLQIIAVSGEFPAAFSGHFPGGCSYIESVIGKLKKDGLLLSLIHI